MTAQASPPPPLAEQAPASGGASPSSSESSLKTVEEIPGLVPRACPAEGGTGLQESFANGTYPEWLRAEAIREERHPHILDDVANEFERLKLLSPEQRVEDYNWVVRYYSRSNKSFQTTSLKLYEHIGCSEKDIEAGTFDSREVARNLLQRMKDYDESCIVPIITQVREYLAVNFSNTNILFLGRDFCSAYLYIVNEGLLNQGNLFLANISRYVRDVALGGKTAELRWVLERIGLTKEVLLEKGLLIADSCMQGKIPAVILKSIALGMNETERYQFLTHSYIRYLRSSRKAGLSIAEKSVVVANGTGQLTDENLETLLSNPIELIEEFKVNYPSIVEEYVPRRHKIFEWRPKLSLIAMGIEVDELGPRLIANEPKTPSEKILSLLGLYGEIELLKASSRVPRDRLHASRATGASSEVNNVNSSQHHGDFEPRKMAFEIALLDSSTRRDIPVRRDLIISASEYQKTVPFEKDWFLKEIDQALLTGGIDGLRIWQSQMNSNVGSVAVMRTNDLNFPYELIINGKVIYRFKDEVGEGNNVKVYATETGTIMKVIKDAKFVRKNLMLAWAEPIVRATGIRTAKVLTVSPTGLYLEQEAVPGESLEKLYGETEKIPTEICDKAIHDFRAAKTLIKEKGIWLDLKSANYHIAKDHSIVNVDYCPRINATYYRYFQTDPIEAQGGSRRELTEDEFLERFFHHDVKKRKCRADSKKSQ